MADSDELLRRLIESLSAEGCITADFEASVIGMVGKLRKARNQAIRDRQAAELLPKGRDLASCELEVAVSTLYKMAHRHMQRFSTAAQQA